MIHYLGDYDSSTPCGKVRFVNSKGLLGFNKSSEWARVECEECLKSAPLLLKCSCYKDTVEFASLCADYINQGLSVYNAARKALVVETLRKGKYHGSQSASA